MHSFEFARVLAPTAAGARTTVRRWLRDTVFATKLIDPPGSIEKFLLTGIERMAARTHIEAQIFRKCRAGLERIATATRDGNFVVCGMGFGLHCFAHNAKGRDSIPRRR